MRVILLCLTLLLFTAKSIKFYVDYDEDKHSEYVPFDLDCSETDKPEDRAECQSNAKELSNMVRIFKVIDFVFMFCYLLFS